MTTSTLNARAACPSPAEFRAARQRAGASQEAAAQSVGVTRLTVARYEAGQTKRPHVTVARGLTRVYRAWLKAAQVVA